MSKDRGEHAVKLERSFPVSVEAMWRAWTEPDQIEKWWGPRGFSTRIESMDVRVGGKWRYVMIEDATGKEYPSEGVFQELIPQKKLVTTDEFGDDMLATNPDLPTGLITTVEFATHGEGTQVTLTISHPTAEDKQKHEAMGVVQGWGESLDKLGESLPVRE